ncbi:hypothetical protein CAEBREN_23772 [Caenorhabditis brenneri]|uniref:Fatty acid desaturase domain-containing protein n=1 Tax=Caenorhabditis brenneri TaxID=135651 RepID=G0N4E9_CAEBE|nr:hypothetical protein CAEBREN_23772 [Caenorhabditis brenneri]
MVLRSTEHEPFYIRIKDRWCYIDEDVLKAHPGGSAITTYRNMEATDVFKAFHNGCPEAHNWLTKLSQECPTQNPSLPEDEACPRNDINLGDFNFSEEKLTDINKSFDMLRMRVHGQGLMRASALFYIRKVLEPIFMILFAFRLQYRGCYHTSAILMGVAWQQLGWLIHEFSHHQVFNKHAYNDLMGYFVGDFLQGFSVSGWKEQHNVHHAATNVVGRDGDLDLVPFYATVAENLEQYSHDSWIMTFFRWQHIHWPFMLPFLRLSWLLQSIIFVIQMPFNFYDYNRKTAVYEQVSLSLHWMWAIAQLYYLPDWTTRISFFLVSNLVGGFLLSHVVTFNHYSVQKYTVNSNIMSCFPCLQILTTRNMKPNMFIDWLWGGLNYQIEHHLFPTMPRHNLNTVMPLVKQFCEENGLPYMVDDYFTGFSLGVEQFKNVASVATKLSTKCE